MSITCVLPQPVPVRLGDRACRVPQLRLRDLAVLQQWLIETVPSPYDDHRRLMEGTSGRGRMVAAARAYLECERFPVKVTSSLGAYLFSTRAGVARLLDVLGVDADAGHVTQSQFDDLWEAAWGGVDALQRLAAILDGPAPEQTPREINWSKQFARVIAETGWTFDQIGEMFVSQWLSYCTGGEDRAAEMAVHPGEDPEVKRQERVRIFQEAEEGSDGG